MTSVFASGAQDCKNTLNFGAGVIYGIGGSISYDYKLINWNEHSALTIGGYAGIQRGDGYAWVGGGNLNYDYKGLFAPRLGYVYSFSRHFELYAALMPGLLINDKYEKPAKYEFFTGITGGGRVQLYKNLYFFMEAGYNLLCYNAGISVKLPCPSLSSRARPE